MKSRWNKIISHKFLYFKNRPALLSGILIAGITISFFGFAFWKDYQSRGWLTVVFFNVGQGDAALIRMPNGDDVLIDGGPDKKVLSKLGRVLPFYDRTIELVILTHPHLDHLAGLQAVLERYKVERVMMTGVEYETLAYKKWLEALEEKKTTILAPRGGESLAFGKARLEIIAPSSDFSERRVAGGKLGEGGGLNDTSIVTRACLEEQCVLFMGDATFAEENEILKNGAPLKARALKVGHHGSKYSTGAEFLAAVRPEFAVISVGKNNYGHPSPRLLGRLKRARARVFRTDEDGDVAVKTDGASMVVSNQF